MVPNGPYIPKSPIFDLPRSGVHIHNGRGGYKKAGKSQISRPFQPLSLSLYIRVNALLPDVSARIFPYVDRGVGQNRESQISE